jgi:hypothetical protein
MPTFPTPTTDGQLFSTPQYDYIWNATTQKWLQKQSNPSLKHRLLSDSASITLDLSAQSSFELNIKGQSLAPVVSFSNPPSQAGKFTVKVKNDFDLQKSVMAYTNRTHSTLAPIGGPTTGSPVGIAFSTDGTRMFMGDDTATRIFQFDLTTPWNIQSRVYNGVSFLTSGITGPLSHNITFSHDGKYIFLMKTDTMFLYRVDLSTAWDLSTASYVLGQFVDLGAKVGLADVATNSQVQFNVNLTNPLLSGSKMIFILGDYLMYEVDFVTPYDLPNAVYNSVTKNLRTVTSRASGLFRGFVFDATGTRIILSDNNGNDIVQINASAAYSVSSTFTVVGTTFSSGSIPSETNIRGMYLKPDETKLFIMGVTLFSVYELNIATGWTSPANFTYGGNSVKFYNTTFGRSYQSARFSTDGKTLFVLTAGTATIFQFDLRIPWDISSMVYANKSFGFEATQSGAQQLYVSPDGIHLFTTGATDDQIEYFRMSTANDISTASYVSSIGHTALPSGAIDQASIYFSNDGKRLFTSTSAAIRWWNLATEWTLSPGATYVGSFAFSTYINVTTLNSTAEIAFSERGDILYFTEQDFNTVFSVKLSTPWDPSTGTFAVETVKFATQTTGTQGFAFSRDSNKCFVLGGNNTNIYEYQSTTQSNTITAAPAFAGYTTGSAQTNIGGGSKDGLLFKPDGMRVWFNMGTTTYQANLTTPWDIQTIQPATTISNISGASGLSALTGMQFSDDGYKFYVNANSTGQSFIAEVPLAQPWDLSTAIIASRLVLPFNSAGGGSISYPFGLHIDPTGTKLYVSGEYSTVTKIYYYTMSKFNLSTISYVGVGTVTTNTFSFTLNATGTELYTYAFTTSGSSMRKYTLTTPWDTRVMTLAATYATTYIYQQYVQSAYFRPDLSEVYFGAQSGLGGYIVKNIFYDVPYTIQWPSSVQWKNNTAPTVPRLDNSSVIDFYTTDGGTTYKGVERISSAYSLQSLY